METRFDIKRDNELMGGRDEHGRFIKGHPYFQAQHGEKCGRKKSIAGQVRDALTLAEENMPEIILMLVEKAKTGDVESAKYLCDRIYGRPNQPMSGAKGNTLQLTLVEVVKDYGSDIKSG